MARALIRRRSLVTLSVAAVLGLSACGGPSQATVIAQGNAICERAVAAVRNVPSSQAGLAAAGAIVAKEAKALDRLPRPAGQLKVLTAFISAEQAFAQEYQALVAAELRGDSAGVTHAETALAANRASPLARRYGLSRCSEAGPTVGSG